MTKLESFVDLINKSSNIVIVGHKWLDLDAIGASIAMHEIVSEYNENVCIFFNDEELEKGVEKVVKEVTNKHENIKMVCESNIEEYINDNALLIMLDHNKKRLCPLGDYLDDFKKIVVIDHHLVHDELPANTSVSFINTSISSTCEMIYDMMFDLNLNIKSFTAGVLLAGIIVDTNNFNVKTTKETFLKSALLIEKGASLKLSQYLFKEDLNKYIKRQQLLGTTMIIGDIAICVSHSNYVYKKEELSKVAEELITFENVQCGIVCGFIDAGVVGISSRAHDKYTVNNLMMKFGGGGHEREAACQVATNNIDEVKVNLLKYIDGGIL